MSGRTVEKTVELKLVPVLPPLDHTFRYYEPENSYFRVTIPPFLQFNQAKIGLKASHSMAHVEMDPKTSGLIVQGRTGVVGETNSLLIFLYNGDSRDGEQLATIRVVVTPLAPVYVQTKAGVQT